MTRTAGRRRTRGADTGRQQDGSRLPQTPQRQAGTSAPPLGDPGTPWQKVLWKRQARADNYTDASFLEALVVNAGVQPVRRYRPIVLASLALAQQLCTVVAAVAIPAHLRSVGAAYSLKRCMEGQMCRPEGRGGVMDSRRCRFTLRRRGGVCSGVKRACHLPPCASCCGPTAQGRVQHTPMLIDSPHATCGESIKRNRNLQCHS